MGKSDIFKVVAAAVLAVASTTTSAATVWDEAASGDLSSIAGSPTELTFAGGSNTVFGVVNSSSDIRDFFTFVVPVGQSLTALTLLAWTDVGSGGAGNTGYLAIKSGATGVIPGPTTSGSLLGGAHAVQALVGLPLLQILAGTPVGGTGFTAPLGPGAYTFVVQQTSGPNSGYGLDFQLTVIPLPAAGWLFGSVLASLSLLRRRGGSRAAARP